MEVDVAIVGAGPAGAALAATLAPRHRVCLLDRRTTPIARIGESLIPAARRLLRDMRLLEAFEREGHAPYLGNRSFWGTREVHTVDFIADPDGAGWHLDRVRFERFLRDAAIARGAVDCLGARVGAVEREGQTWRMALDPGGSEVRSRLLVDATGRNAVIAKRLGATRVHTDRLVAAWAHYTLTPGTSLPAGFSTVESARDGWWYTAPLPVPPDEQAARCVLAFHTDGDLGDERLATAADLAAAASALPGMGSLLRASTPTANAPLQRTAAHTAYLSNCTGAGWLAIGDAALSLDPLSSRGLFNALYTAFAAAMACHDWLRDDPHALDTYAQDLAVVRDTYRRQRELTYSAERRWRHAPFWQRRCVDHEASARETLGAIP